jgi:tetratricopeptide (TPR) repeat protein
MNQNRLKNQRKTAVLLSLFLGSLSPLLLCSERLGAGSPAVQTSTSSDPGQTQILEEAKSKLQAGVNSWNAASLESARNAFLSLLLKSPEPNGYLLYYVALSDYRLASYHLSAGNNAEGERYVSEGQQYAAKAAEANSSFGESHALYAFLLGLEIAFHPERAMTLGMKSFEWFAKAMDIGADNPRINLLKGIYQLYIPEAYGGGPASALEFLEKSAALFETENVRDPLKPSWGKEEAYSYLGRIYGQHKDYDKAKSFLTKALAVNPHFGMAQAELQNLSKSDKER